MLQRSVRIKLVAFVLVTLVSLSALALGYMRVGEKLGIGVYEVAMELPDAGGLYPNSQVSYRGVAVGVVEALNITDRGVSASLRLDDDVRIPSDLKAEVRSTSVVGEQYVDLVPSSSSAAGPVLRPGTTIPAEQVSLPVSTSTLLKSSSSLLGSIPVEDLALTVDELGQAFNGSEDDLGNLIDNAIEFQGAAQKDLKPTLSLLRDLQTVLETQDAGSEDIATYGRELSDLTGVLVRRDADLRKLVARGGGFLTETDKVVATLQTDLPPLAQDIATTGNVLETFIPSLEHLLTVFPSLITAFPSVVPPERLDDPETQANLEFKLNINTPPACTKGFADADKARSVGDLTPLPPPTDSYCKVPQDDPRVVRGARNIPCVNNPSRRSASARDCGLVFDRYTAASTSARALPVGGIDPQTDRATTAGGATMNLRDLAMSGSAPADWRELLSRGVEP